MPWAAVTTVVLACSTMLTSLHADWQASSALVARYGVTVEANPIVRVLGADAYFGALTLITAATCREDPRWRWAAVGLWLIETWALNRHQAWGTYRMPALLFVEARW